MPVSGVFLDLGANIEMKSICLAKRSPPDEHGLLCEIQIDQVSRGFAKTTGIETNRALKNAVKSRCPT